MVRRLQKYCLPEELKPEFTSLMSDLAVLVRRSHRNPLLPGSPGQAAGLLSNASQREDLLPNGGQHGVPLHQAEFGYNNLYRWNK